MPVIDSAHTQVKQLYPYSFEKPVEVLDGLL